jgi:epoxide hydrolase-like predicted phosphatase
MSNIEAVIFDAGGVLIEQNDAVSKDLKRELGLRDEALAQLWEEYIPIIGSGKIDETEFWARVSNRFGIREVSPSEDLLGRAFKENLIVYNSVLGYARELGANGIKLAILSDTNESHTRILTDAGVYEPFRQLFLSHETGIRKPDPRIYDLVVREMEIEPARSIYVDDKLDNLTPAADLGMKTVHARTPKQTIEDIGAHIG